MQEQTDNPIEHRAEATEEGGTVLEQFAKSHHGRTIYHLQDDGIPMAADQKSMTKFQQRVYMTAKAYWSSKEQDEAKSNTPSNPRGASRHF